MCSSATIVNTLEKEWQAIFPSFASITGSRMFIKKLMAMSLSALTYMRGVFPEIAYGTRELSGIKLKILSEDSNIEAVNKFIYLIRSCFDAIEMKYLKQLNIGICTDDAKTDEVIESYNLCFKYREDENSVICNNEKSPKITDQDTTVSATLWLLKGITQMNSLLKPLPKKSYLTMKLLYNDEITPPDYEPIGFEPSDCEKYTFASNAVKLDLGRVATNIHGYKMDLKTTLGKEPLIQAMEESVMGDSQESGQSQTDIQVDNPEDTMETRSDTDKIIDDITVNCLCDCKNDAGTDFLCCINCMKRQHSICYGFLKSAQCTSCFYCNECINEAPINESQMDVVYELTGSEQMNLCAMRRTIAYCTTMKYLTLTQLEKYLGCRRQLAREVIENMESKKFIKKVGKWRYAVNTDIILSSGYQTYFPANENKENHMKQKSLKVKQDKKSDRILKHKKSDQGIESDEEYQSQPKKKKGASRIKEVIKLQ